jgi:hypothetical protein
MQPVVEEFVGNGTSNKRATSSDLYQANQQAEYQHDNGNRQDRQQHINNDRLHRVFLAEVKKLHPGTIGVKIRIDDLDFPGART